MKKISYLTDNDIVSAGCMSADFVLNTVEKVLVDYENKRVLYPDKICQIFEQEFQSRINALPVTLLDDNVCGIKWISVFPNNPFKYKISNISSLVLLSSIEDGFPFAILAGTLCSNMRTAAVGTIAAKYLCNKNPETIGFIGAGEQAKMHLYMMKSQFPSLKKCKISSRTEKSEKEFVSQMKNIFSDIEFELCNSEYKKSATGSDIIVTAISGQSDILKAEWIKDGAFYCHVGGIEDEKAVPKKADKIVCDNWEMVKHRKQTISMMYQNGELNDMNIYADLPEIVSGKKIGRGNTKEFIYFNSVGLSYVDVALSYEIYKKCNEKSLGTLLDYIDESIFSKINEGKNE